MTKLDISRRGTDTQRAALVEQLRARRAPKAAAGDKLAIAMQAAGERAKAEQEERDRRERDRLRRLLDLDDVEAVPASRRRRLSERDIARTITAHLKSGLGVARTETDPATGRFVVIAGSPERTEIAPKSTNEWDEVFNDGSH